jgi:HEAT repeat protein
VPILLRWLDDDDQHSRLSAAALILRIDPSQQGEMLAVLRGGMESDDTGIRCLVAWLLSGLRDVTPEAIPLLRQMLDDEDELVREVVEEEVA